MSTIINTLRSNNSIQPYPNEYWQYLNQTDLPEALLQHYKGYSTSLYQLEATYLYIEEWLAKKQTIPLVIQQSSDVDHSMILSKWVGYHQGNKKPDVIITYFASQGNKNYFYAIYYILNKLREILDIRQKVELQEEKLRQYFEYWLGICSRQLENQVINDSPIQYNRVIIIVEGIDQFNQNNEESKVSFWLPRQFPENVQLIVTAKQGSKSIEYLIQRQCQILQLLNDDKQRRSYIEQQYDTSTWIEADLKQKVIETIVYLPRSLAQNCNFLKCYFGLLLPQTQCFGLDLEAIIRSFITNTRLQKITTMQDFIELVFDEFQIILVKKDFISIVQVMALTYKGLTIEEIQHSTGLSNLQMDTFFTVFSTFFIKHNDVWMLANNLFKEEIKRRYLKSQSIVDTKDRIIKALENNQNSIRSLDEITYHLYQNGAYFKLKETIINIENFLLLFNSNSQFDVCRYWQKLEEQGFDPVLEYNKALETFQDHFRPQSEDLFSIMIQICRFLKKYNDFENYVTPEFRHPPIRGYQDDINDIGLFQELEQSSLFKSVSKGIAYRQKAKIVNNNEQDDLEKLKQRDSILIQRKTLQQQKVQDEYFVQGSRRNIQTLKKLSVANTTNESMRVIKSDEQKDTSRQDESQSLDKLNVDVPVSRQIFISFYLKQLQSIIDEEETESKTTRDKEDDEKDDLPQGLEEALQQIQPLKRKVNLDQHVESLLRRQYSQKQDETPKDYYYKRWLWVQFPWLCMSFKQNYSTRMQQCYSQQTKYMSVQEENNLFRQSLKVVFDAKLKKKLLQAQPSYQESSIVNQNKKNISVISAIPMINYSINRSISQHSVHKSNKDEDPYQLPVLRNNSQSKVDENIFLTQEQLDNYKVTTKVKAPRMIPYKQNNELSKLLKPKQTNQIDLSYLLNNNTKSKDINQSVSILPRLQNKITDHSIREINVMVSQKDSFKRQFDQLVYQKRLEELRKIQSNQVGSQNLAEIQKARQQMELLEIEMVRTDKQVQKALQEKHRIVIILKICHENHSQNEEWIRNLDFLLMNLTKLLSMEYKTIQQMNEQISQIQKTTLQYKNAVLEKTRQQRHLIVRIKQNVQSKEEFDRQFQNSQNIIQREIQEQQQKLKERFHNQNQRASLTQIKSELGKSSQEVEQKLQNLKGLYNIMVETININDMNDISQNQDVKEFIKQLSTKRDLLSNKLSKERYLNDLQTAFNQESQKLKSLQNLHQIEKQNNKIQKSKSLVTDQEQLTVKQIGHLAREANRAHEQKSLIKKKLQGIKSSQILFLENLKAKLELGPDSFGKGQETINIINMLLMKKETIRRNLHIKEYNQFMSSQLPLSLIYKHLVQSYPNPALMQKSLYDEGDDV